MSQDETGYAATDPRLASYDFGAAPAVEGYDPDASGWKKPPVGEYIFEVDLEHSKVVTDKNIKWDGSTYILNEFQPRLMLVEGPQAAIGATITDFIPMPTANQVWHSGLANKWANFIKAFGFPPPGNRYAPDGFSLDSLHGKRAHVTVEGQTRKVDGEAKKREPVMDADGTQKVTVKMYGYRMTEATEKELRSKGWSPAKSQRPAVQTVSQTPQPHVAASGAVSAADVDL